MDFKLQPGGQRSHPQELTQVSDRGVIVQVTTLQFERRRVCRIQNKRAAKGSPLRYLLRFI
ncbi:hypothetical protein D4100_18130 [Serratia inhibens]|uniref:Uncharacterized protein n=1 Tax=Serratia inhibens TaxID=2338073 RepID=A0AA92X1Y6_9GAMM|nr:hypothetical protein D4100_18130 [Serratia inhibens]